MAEREDTVFCDDGGLWVRDPLGNCRPFDINDYESMRDERARLRAALEPFAAKLADIGEDEDDQDGFAEMSPANRRAPRITVGDFRRARAALNTSKG